MKHKSSLKTGKEPRELLRLSLRSWAFELGITPTMLSRLAARAGVPISKRGMTLGAVLRALDEVPAGYRHYYWNKNDE